MAAGVRTATGFSSTRGGLTAGPRGFAPTPANARLLKRLAQNSAHVVDGPRRKTA